MAFFGREMAVRARDIIDHECAFGKTSEEVYQDLCVDVKSLEVLHLNNFNFNIFTDLFRLVSAKHIMKNLMLPVCIVFKYSHTPSNNNRICLES